MRKEERIVKPVRVLSQNQEKSRAGRVKEIESWQMVRK
jgi:hypothetical protein